MRERRDKRVERREEERHSRAETIRRGVDGYGLLVVCCLIWKTSWKAPSVLAFPEAETQKQVEAFRKAETSDHYCNFLGLLLYISYPSYSNRSAGWKVGFCFLVLMKNVFYLQKIATVCLKVTDLIYYSLYKEKQEKRVLSQMSLLDSSKKPNLLQNDSFNVFQTLTPYCLFCMLI